MSIESQNHQEDLWLNNENSSEKLQNLKTQVEEKINQLKQDGYFSDQDLDSIIDLFEEEEKADLKEDLKNIKDLEEQINFLMSLVELWSESEDLKEQKKESKEKEEIDLWKKLEITRNISDILEKWATKYNINKIIDFLGENNTNLIEFNNYFKNLKKYNWINDSDFENIKKSSNLNSLKNTNKELYDFLVEYNKLDSVLFKLSFKNKELYKRLETFNQMSFFEKEITSINKIFNNNSYEVSKDIVKEKKQETLKKILNSDKNIKDLYDKFINFLNENNNTLNTNNLNKFLNENIDNFEDFYKIQLLTKLIVDEKDYINLKNTFLNIKNDSKNIDYFKKIEETKEDWNYDLYENSKLFDNEIFLFKKSSELKKNIDNKIKDWEKINQLKTNNLKSKILEIFKNNDLKLNINDYFDEKLEFNISLFSEKLFKEVWEKKEIFSKVFEEIKSIQIAESNAKIKENTERINNFLSNPEDAWENDKIKNYLDKNWNFDQKKFLEDYKIFREKNELKNIDTFDTWENKNITVVDLNSLRFLESLWITKENKLYKDLDKILFEYDKQAEISSIDSKKLYEHIKSGWSYDSFVEKIQNEKIQNLKNQKNWEKGENIENSNIFSWDFGIDIKNWTFENKNWEKIHLSPEDIKIVEKSPEAAKNIINFYESLEKVWMKKLWSIKENIFKSVENTFNLQFDRKDRNFLDAREIKIFLNSVLKSVWEKTIKMDLPINNFLSQAELINGRQISWAEKQVNNYWETKIEKLFIEKFMPKWDLLWFKQSLFEESLK